MIMRAPGAEDFEQPAYDVVATVHVIEGVGQDEDELSQGFTEVSEHGHLELTQVMKVLDGIDGDLPELMMCQGSHDCCLDQIDEVK